jgi:site-specific DNA-methyltransferase (adenine-specific)/adenine-specific DNA-methyltransferase
VDKELQLRERAAELSHSQSREIELTSAPHESPAAGRYTVAVKVVDIFGNDTMSTRPVVVR